MTSDDINELASRTCEPLSYCQWSTRGVDLDRWFGMGAGLKSWTATGKGSKRIILRVNAGLKITADQGVFSIRLSHNETHKELVSCRRFPWSREWTSAIQS